MATAPIYEVCRASSAVRALLGNKPRIYNFGQAPEKATLPYVTCFIVTGAPNNNLSDLPDNDYYNLQVDIFGENEDSVGAVKIAIREAIELVTHITSWNGEGRDRATTNYRCTFSVDWYIGR